MNFSQKKMNAVLFTTARQMKSLCSQLGTSAGNGLSKKVPVIFHNFERLWQFFNSLKDEFVCEKYYQRANNIWNAFKMKKMSDYHDLYLKTCLVINKCV